MQETIELQHDPAGDRDELEPGLVVAGSYRLCGPLGAGGMADVYEAEHVRLGNRVALKVLRTNARGDARGLERFRHEARRVAALKSEHVVQVFDCGELPNGMPYLVMERLPGEDLKSLLGRESPLPVRRSVELALGACRGLAAVHAAGLVHRDLKPANLFVVRRWDGTDFCKILDFGVAKALLSDTTASGTVLGTVRYMAPEQLENPSAARATADIYAVGAILYESLTGTPPHSGETLRELMFGILNRDIVPPSQHREMPSELEAVIQKALARDPSQRFPTAEAMAHALAPFGALPLRPRAPEGAQDQTIDEQLEMPRTSASRNRTNRALSLALALALTLLVFGAIRGSKHEAVTKIQPAAPVVTVAAQKAPPAPAKTSEPPTLQEVAGAPTATLARQPEAAPSSAHRRAKAPAKPPLTAPASLRVPEARADRFDAKDPYSE